MTNNINYLLKYIYESKMLSKVISIKLESSKQNKKKRQKFKSNCHLLKLKKNDCNHGYFSNNKKKKIIYTLFISINLRTSKN